MGLGSFVHHIGSVLLLVATVLLIVADVSAPVVKSLSILRVNLAQGAGRNEVTFGTFGYCHRGVNDGCSSHIGYNPALIITQIDRTRFDDGVEGTAEGLTGVMVLHSVTTVLCFIAFLFCISAGIIGSLMATAASLVAFIITIIAMACDFFAFGLIKHNINEHGPGTASWGSAIWCILLATIFTLIASVLVFFTCCAGRAKDRQAMRSKEASFAGSTVPTRRRFWKRGARY